MIEFDSDVRGDVVVIRPKGRMDAFTMPPLETWLDEAHERGDSRIVMNMGNVEFVDTHTISVLVQTMKRCREAGGDFVLCALARPVRIILELMRLDLAFTIVEAEGDAFV